MEVNTVKKLKHEVLKLTAEKKQSEKTSQNENMAEQKELVQQLEKSQFEESQLEQQLSISIEQQQQTMVMCQDCTGGPDGSPHRPNKITQPTSRQRLASLQYSFFSRSPSLPPIISLSIPFLLRRLGRTRHLEHLFRVTNETPNGGIENDPPSSPPPDRLAVDATHQPGLMQSWWYYNTSQRPPTTPKAKSFSFHCP